MMFCEIFAQHISPRQRLGLAIQYLTIAAYFILLLLAGASWLLSESLVIFNMRIDNRAFCEGLWNWYVVGAPMMFLGMLLTCNFGQKRRDPSLADPIKKRRRRIFAAFLVLAELLPFLILLAAVQKYYISVYSHLTHGQYGEHPWGLFGGIYSAMMYLMLLVSGFPPFFSGIILFLFPNSNNALRFALSSIFSFGVYIVLAAWFLPELIIWGFTQTL